MGPFKCPDCGVWWAGLQHRCGPAEVDTAVPFITDTYTVRCSCCFDADGRRVPTTGTCMVHDINVTYTLSSLTA